VDTSGLTAEQIAELARQMAASKTTVPTGLLVGLGLIALYFATRKKTANISVSGFGSYGKRRRVRRSRR
jgi:hypothetical protein